MNSGISVEVDQGQTGSRTATVAGVVIAILGLPAVVSPLARGGSASLLLGAVLVVGVTHALQAVLTGGLGNAPRQSIPWGNRG
jgi:uncharacterized membrane protein HdeD (DUF308 family)